MFATLLPQPDSPTIPSVSPFSDGERSAVDRLDHSVVGVEVDLQVLDLEQDSLVPNPRVEVRVGDVDDQVADDDEERAEQGDSLDHGQVGAS